MIPTAGLYIHIPFCASKCPYCDFYSVPFTDEAADLYTASLCRAIRTQPFGALKLDTIYFGGGTPILMGARRLSLILDEAARCFSLDGGAEITLEANPVSALRNGLGALREAGFNRISFGVQSGVDSELLALGRRHTAGEAGQAIQEAALAGFGNISADLMLGIPGQTPESLTNSICYLMELPLSHISAYMLKIEPDTPFGRQKAALPLPDEDETARLYLECIDGLETTGFVQYEISNFAKNGAVSHHNLKYWRGEPYLGLGTAAHSYINNNRFYFPRDISSFISGPEPFSLTVRDGEGGGFEEYVMLRLRLIDGINITELTRLYPSEAIQTLKVRAQSLEPHGLVTVKGDTVKLTPKGFLLSNSVTAKLLYG